MPITSSKLFSSFVAGFRRFAVELFWSHLRFMMTLALSDTDDDGLLILPIAPGSTGLSFSDSLLSCNGSSMSPSESSSSFLTIPCSELIHTEGLVAGLTLRIASSSSKNLHVLRLVPVTLLLSCTFL